MKLQFKSLRVIGCGPLQQDTLIDFCDADGTPRPVTVLAGANGSGKTTVLELIVALCDTFSSVKHPATLAMLKRTQYAQLDCLVDDALPFSIFSERFSPVDVKCAPDYIGIQIQEDHVDPISTQGELYKQLRDMVWVQEQGDFDFTFADVQQAFKEFNGQHVFPLVLYLPYFRNLFSVQGERVERSTIKYKWLYRYQVAREFVDSLDSYLIWLDYAQPEAYKQVITFLNSLDFDGKTFGVQRRELKAVVTTRDGQTHAVSQLSSGEQNILITLLELRRRLLPHSLVLIDEIENSLHPAFQHRLAQGWLRLQADVPFQLIVTTHSPTFVEIFGAENTLLLCVLSNLIPMLLR